MADSDRVVPLHPVPEVSSEERARRLQAEVERLASSQMSASERALYLDGTEGYSERFGIDKATLKHMVTAVIKEREKKEHAEKAEQRRIEDRAEKQRVAKEREEGRLDRQAKKDAEKKAEKKECKRQGALAALAKLPRSLHETNLRQLARQFGEDIDGLRAELELLLADAEAAIVREAGEPWLEPVNTKELLDETLAQIRRYIVIHDDAAAIIHTVAIPFAWVHDEVATFSPLLVVQGADMDEAKTTLCHIHSMMTPRQLVIGKPTGPTIYRLVDAHHPTLYVDNADKLLARDRDLADIINLSWTRGTKIPRTERGVVHLYNPCCFKVMNGVDVLPHLDPATRSRCITTEMLPKLPGEEVIDFERAAGDERFSVLRRKWMRWAIDNVEAVRGANPAMPEGFNNRLAKNYRILFAIADLAGGDWPKKVRAAAVKLSREYNMPSMRRRLLAVFYDLFSRYGKLLTSEQVETAVRTYGDEWAHYVSPNSKNQRGHPITKWETAALLRPFKIYPGVIHPRGGNTCDRGYDVAWFEIPFRHTTLEKPCPEVVRSYGNPNGDSANSVRPYDLRRGWRTN